MSFSVQGLLAQTCQEDIKWVYTGKPNIADSYGRSVAIDTNRIVVAASNATGNDTYDGAIFVYDWDGSQWNETKLWNSAGANSDIYGNKVDIEGDKIIVGAVGDNHGPLQAAGSAFLYEWDGTNWIETHFTASDMDDVDRFGTDVAVSGDRVVVGAHYEDTNGENSGSIYVYTNNAGTWTEEKIITSDGQSNHFFGKTLDMVGDRIVATAIGDDENGAFSGSVYIFDWDGTAWIETKITPADGAAGDWFGSDVSLNIDGDRLVASSEYDFAGSAYVFDYDGTTWNEIVKLEPTGGVDFDRFGGNVNVNEDNVIIGATSTGDNGTGSGAVYVYKWDGVQWDESKIITSDGEASDGFGSGVAVLDTIYIAGQQGDDDGGFNSGAIYFIDCCGTQYFLDNDGDGYGDPTVSLDGCAAPVGYVIDNTDCDDNDPNNYPNNIEICDGLDNNCDGIIDEGCGPEPCDDFNLVINNITQDTSRAFINIYSDAIINQAIPVQFNAGTDIDLNTGFEVVGTTVFEVLINPCDDSDLMQQEEESDRNK